MRGGAIPLLAWGTLLAVLLAINWIWTGDALQVGQLAFAVAIICTSGLLLWLARREAIRRGPPQPRPDPEAVPQSSLSAVLVGLAIACAGFGVVWSWFLVYFGAGVLLLSAGRLVIELRSERRSVQERRR